MRHLTLAVNAEWVESGWGRCTAGARGGDLQEWGWEVQGYEPSLRRWMNLSKPKHWLALTLPAMGLGGFRVLNANFGSCSGLCIEGAACASMSYCAGAL